MNIYIVQSAVERANEDLQSTEAVKLSSLNARVFHDYLGESTDQGRITRKPCTPRTSSSNPEIYMSSFLSKESTP